MKYCSPIASAIRLDNGLQAAGGIFGQYGFGGGEADDQAGLAGGADEIGAEREDGEAARAGALGDGDVVRAMGG